MPSYSSWNGEKMHGNKHLLTDLLKKELGFKVRCSGAFINCFVELDFRVLGEDLLSLEVLFEKGLAKSSFCSSWEW
jgi:hypothetical protein